MERPPSSPREEPLPKKPKMSTTSATYDSDGNEVDVFPTTTADVAATTTASLASDGPRKPRYKRRKVAIFFAYCGVGYQGMQKNPGAKTIEGELEEALYRAGAVPEQDRGRPQRYEWARSARTDKGVSAVGQVVSGRFYVDPPGFVQRLQSNLPDQIHIFGYKRVTASFNAKKFCDRRRYVYLLPVFALDPTCHRDRESVMASVGSENELAKCLECSERGRKVEGLMGKREFRGHFDQDLAVKNEKLVASGLVAGPDKSLHGGDAVVGDETDAPSNVSSNNEDRKTSGTEGTPKEQWLNAEGQELTSGVPNCNVEENVEKVKKTEFFYGEAEKQRFNRILKHYEGTHNFHNFTTRTKAEDPSARRYIVSFEANTTVTIEGTEFVKCEVVGQSFMLHQIRKMMGLAVAVMRNITPESIYETAFYQSVKFNVPTAPEVGLYLDECLFTTYNNRWTESHEEVSMKSYVQEAEEFKMKYIYSHIANTEHKEGAVGLWLHSLNYRNYPDLRASDAKRKDDTETGKQTIAGNDLNGETEGICELTEKKDDMDSNSRNPKVDDTDKVDDSNNSMNVEG